MRIDNATGVVYLDGAVPQPEDEAYRTGTEVQVVAIDGGGRSSQVTLKITIQDEFPEAPQFESHIYNATVIENRDFFQSPLIVKVKNFKFVFYINKI